MKLEGIDIKKHTTTRLLSVCKIYSFLIPFYFLFGAFFAFGATLPFMEPSMLEDMWVLIPICLIGATVFIWVGIALIQKVRGIKKEIDSRKISAEESEAANSFVKKIFWGSIAIIVVSVLIIAIAVGSAVGRSSGSSTGSGERCRNCGRSGKLVAGFGYCYDCYDGFRDWQDRTQK